jgi:hypothetical protein
MGSGVEGAVLEIMNAGLAELEAHPVLARSPAPADLARFEAHSLIFARAFGRLLERRVARNLDRDAGELGQIARIHLRIHQPFPRALEAALVRLGRPRAELERLELGPAGQRVLERAETALGARDVPGAHVLLLSGLECLTQLLAKRGADLAAAAGREAERYEARHDGHESLVFMGLRTLSRWPDAQTAHVPEALAALFRDAAPWLDTWAQPPPERRRERARRRASRWGTGDLPDGAA